MLNRQTYRFNNIHRIFMPRDNLHCTMINSHRPTHLYRREDVNGWPTVPINQTFYNTVNTAVLIALRRREKCHRCANLITMLQQSDDQPGIAIRAVT